MIANPAGQGRLRRERQGAVLVLVLAHPPVNALSAALRTELDHALDSAALDPEVQALVIASDLPHFSAGADLNDLLRAESDQSLSVLCTRIERFAKPVVVALNGSALGGGLELALAAHVRLAGPEARFGLPEVNLGLLPGAGGTQRLPRLVGAEVALALLLEAQPLGAAQALAVGLVDEVAETGLRARAVAVAAALAGRHPPRTADRRDGMRDPQAYQAAVARARAHWAAHPLPAPLRIVACIEAAQLLPINQGLMFERTAFDDLLHSPESQGLRHAVLAERRATALPAALRGLALPALDAVAIWGGGEVAADLAVQLLGQGLSVTLVDPRRAELLACVDKIAHRQEALVAQNRLTPAEREADWARLVATLDAERLSGAPLVLLAPEAPALAAGEVAVPVLALGGLPLAAKPGAIALRPAPAAGLLAELAVQGEAAGDVMELALALARRMGWRLLITGPGGPIDLRLRQCLAAVIADLETQGLDRPTIAAALGSYGLGVPHRPGPAPEAADRVLSAALAALANQGARLLSQGVAHSPAQVDFAALSSGLFPRWQGGPMYQADRRGLLVVRADLRRRSAAAPHLFTPDPLFDRLVAEGRDFADLDRALPN